MGVVMFTRPLNDQVPLGDIHRFLRGMTFQLERLLLNRRTMIAGRRPLLAARQCAMLVGAGLRPRVGSNRDAIRFNPPDSPEAVDVPLRRAAASGEATPDKASLAYSPCSRAPILAPSCSTCPSGWTQNTVIRCRAQKP